MRKMDQILCVCVHDSLRRGFSGKEVGASSNFGDWGGFGEKIIKAEGRCGVGHHWYAGSSSRQFGAIVPFDRIYHVSVCNSHAYYAMPL